MGESCAGWLAPGARRHVARMLRALAPQTAALNERFAGLLSGMELPPGAQAALVAVTPQAAAGVRPLDAFFPRVERRGRELGRMGLGAAAITALLREFDDAVGAALEGRFQPAREQLHLATAFALYRGFYEAREAEVRRLESQARRAEEQERRRIGRELHDEAGQSLLLLRLRLEMLEREAPENARPALQEARATVERIVIELRRIVAALSPAVLERLGLEAALRQMAARVEKACGAAVRLRIGRGASGLRQEAQDVLYRVAQEALQNVAKHARATTVNLSLQITDKSVRLSVSDNGAGFTTEQAGARRSGFGLAGMQERASLLGGTLGVRSVPGNGATVTLRLPVSGTVTPDGENSCTAD